MNFYIVNFNCKLLPVVSIVHRQSRRVAIAAILSPMSIFLQSIINMGHVWHTPVRVRKTRRSPLKIRTYSRTSPVKILEIKTNGVSFETILADIKIKVKILEIKTMRKLFPSPTCFLSTSRRSVPK